VVVISPATYNSEIGRALCGEQLVITSEYMEWQNDLLLQKFRSRGNIFYDKSILFPDLPANDELSRLFGIVLGRIGCSREHSGSLNSCDFVVYREITCPIKHGFEEILDNVHKPSYVAPFLLTYSNLIGLLYKLCTRHGGDANSLEVLNTLSSKLQA
jgi:hypothetical protein